MPGRQLDDLLWVRSSECISRQDQAAVRLARKTCNCGLDVHNDMKRDSISPYAERRRRGLDRAHEKLDCGDVSGLNMTATRATRGAASLSRPSHLPPVENS